MVSLVTTDRRMGLLFSQTDFDRMDFYPQVGMEFDLITEEAEGNGARISFALDTNGKIRRDPSPAIFVLERIPVGISCVVPSLKPMTAGR